MTGLKFRNKRFSRAERIVFACFAVLLAWIAIAPGTAHADEDPSLVANGLWDEQDVEAPVEQSQPQATEQFAAEAVANDGAPVSTESPQAEVIDADDVINDPDDEPANDDEDLPTGLLADGDSFIYRHSDGAQAKSEWITSGGATYYFGESGRALRWGQKLVGKDGVEHFYYFDKNCQMVTGWITWNNDGTKSYFGSDGAALLGWQTIGNERYYFSPATGRSYLWSHDIDGAHYYFNAQSQMVKGLVTWNADGLKSYFGDDGKRRTGWVQVSGKWYYFAPDTGKSVRWSQNIGGNWFYFNEKCEMHTGLLTWSKDGLKSYYDPKTGRRQTGWKQVGSKWYYFSPSTGKSVRWSQYINGNWFYFNERSEMHTGLLTWSKDGSKSYFDPKTGRRQTGWQTVAGNRYYFSPSTGKSLRWSQVIGGANYYFDAQSRMVTGLVTWNKDGSKSYFGADGKRVTGWKNTSNGVWYYFSPSSGKSIRWHQRINGNWFYFGADYKMHRGWLKWSGVQKWSYFYENGRQAFGTQVIGGYRYTFDNNGETSTKPVTLPAGQLAMWNKAQNYYSNTNYIIMVNSSTHKVGVFRGSSYNWEPVWYWDCTTGAPGSPTVKGTYTVGSRGKSFGSGYTCWYWTQFYGNYLFHSVLYQPGSMSRIQDGRLGISASHGCVRLDIECARWIYNNIPRGTRVVSY